MAMLPQPGLLRHNPTDFSGLVRRRSCGGIRLDDDLAEHVFVSFAAEDAAAHGVGAEGLGEEADRGGLTGLDRLVNAEAAHAEAVFDVGGGDDEFDAGALGNDDAAGVDGPFFHHDFDHGVGRAGVGGGVRTTGKKDEQADGECAPSRSDPGRG